MANVVINGTDILVFIEGVAVAHSTSHTLTMQMATRDTSNKDSGIWNSKAVGRLDVTATAEALIVYTDFTVMAEALLNRVPVHVAFGQRSADVLDETVFYAEGNFIITSLDMSAADQANASYTCTFEHHDGFTLSTQDHLRVNMTKSDATTLAGTDGFAAAIVKGGTAPYTYLWNNVAESTTQYITAQPAGTYTCTVTDAALDVVIGTVVISEPAA